MFTTVPSIGVFFTGRFDSLKLMSVGRKSRCSHIMERACRVDMEYVDSSVDGPG